MAAQLNPAEALLVFTETKPDWEAITMWDYDFDSFLIFAKNKKQSGTDYNDPYFLIYKKGGLIERYSSMDDFDKFAAATDRTPIMTKKAGAK